MSFIIDVTEKKEIENKYYHLFNSIPDALRAEGFTVYELKVGPFSSNWDRAVEAFYDLKGGQIDYGIAHSEEHGHNRFSRTLEGKFPEWGELNSDGTRKKVHVVSHSMGGPTARAFAYLLANVFPEEGDSQLFSENLRYLAEVI